MSAWRMMPLSLVAIVAIFFVCGTLPHASFAEVARLTLVGALPEPQLPNWIIEISPVGATHRQVQLRVRFLNPLITNMVDVAQRERVLRFMRISPNAPGHFRMVSPRLVAFESDPSIPMATRYQVTVERGLSDIEGNVLATPIVWTFDTPPIRFRALLDRSFRRLDTCVPIAANVPRTKLSSFRFSFVGGGETIAGNPKDCDDNKNLADNGAAPMRPLTPATRYEVIAESGARTDDGNLGSSRQSLGFFTTYQPLRLDRIDRGVDRIYTDFDRAFQGTPVLVFNNFIDDALIAKNVTFNPPLPMPNSAFEVRHSEINGVDGTSVRVDPGQLQQDATYEVHIAAGLMDTVGQHAVPETISFHVSLAGSIEGPHGLVLLPPGAPTMTVAVKNLPDASFLLQTRTIRPEELLNDGTPLDALSDQKDWTQVRVPISASPSIPVGPSRSAYGVVAFGARIVPFHFATHTGETNEASEYKSAFVNRTNLGMSAQWAGGHAVVRVSRLTDGLPVAHVEISLLPMHGNGRRTCGRGTTDDDGVWVSNAVAADCFGIQNAKMAPAFTVIGRIGPDWTFAPVVPHRIEQFETDETIDGAVLTDRGVYRPGDYVHIAGCLYFAPRSSVMRPLHGRVHVTVDGVGVRNPLLDSFGRFTTTMRFSATDSVVGEHAVVVTQDDVPGSISGGVRVAEVRVPKFENDLTIETPLVFVGNTLIAKSSVQMSTGKPLANANVSFISAIAALPVSPLAFQKYTFGTAVYPHVGPSAMHSELQLPDLVTQTDDRGFAFFKVPISGDVQLPFAVHVKSSASAPNGEAVDSVSSEVLIEPRRAYVGVDVPTFGSRLFPFFARVIAADIDGKLRMGHQISVRLERITQSVRNPEVPNSGGDVYTQLSEQRIISATRAIPVNFGVLPAGSYEVEASFADRKEPDLYAQARFEVVGSQAEASSDRGTSIILDRVRYRAGDVARAAIVTPFADADVFVEVYSDHDIWHVTKRLAKAGIVEIPITPWMIPNARIQVIAVRRARLPESDADVARSVSGATVELAVSADIHTLNVSVRASAYMIGEPNRTRLHVRVTDARSRGVTAGLIISVVDDTVLALDGYRFADLTASLFPHRSIYELGVDNRLSPRLTTRKYRFEDQEFEPGQTVDSYSVLQPSNALPRFSRLPKNAVALFRADLRTDRFGNASIPVDLPGNATKWRVMVAAISGAPAFGNAETTFRSIDQASLTSRVRFVRPADRLLDSEQPSSADPEIDAVTTASVPLLDRVVDANVIASTDRIASGPIGGLTTFSILGIPPTVVDTNRKRLQINRKSYSAPISSSMLAYEFYDRSYIESFDRRHDSNGVNVGPQSTAYEDADFVRLARATAPELLSGELANEAMDPTAAGLCIAPDKVCISRVRLRALYALESIGDSRFGPILNTVSGTIDDADFTYSELLRLAIILASERRYETRYEALRQKVDSLAYVGNTFNVYPPDEETSVGVADMAALRIRLGLALHEDEASLLRIVRGTLREAAAIDSFEWQDAFDAFVRAFPPTQPESTVTFDEHSIPLGSAMHKMSIEIGELAAQRNVVLEAKDRALSYSLVTAISLPSLGQDEGIGIRRYVRVVQDLAHPRFAQTLDAGLDTGAVNSVELDRGTLLCITIRVAVDHDVQNVRVTDQIPSGLEVVDASLPINATFADSPYTWPKLHFFSRKVESDVFGRGAGAQEIVYFARVVASGTYVWPPAFAETIDESGDRGSTPQTTIDVR